MGPRSGSIGRMSDLSGGEDNTQQPEYSLVKRLNEKAKMKAINSPTFRTAQKHQNHMSKVTEYELNRYANVIITDGMPTMPSVANTAHIDKMKNSLSYIHSKLNTDPRYRVPETQFQTETL